MSDKVEIAKLYREFEDALTEFVAASLSMDNDLGVVLPRRARLAKVRERLCSHPEVEQAKYDHIILKAWDMKRGGDERDAWYVERERGTGLQERWDERRGQ